jgi:hypothetical protein
MSQANEPSDRSLDRQLRAFIAEVRSQKSEVRSQKSEVRSQKLKSVALMHATITLPVSSKLT